MSNMDNDDDNDDGDYDEDDATVYFIHGGIGAWSYPTKISS